jgi:hypothetical protein
VSDFEAQLASVAGDGVLLLYGADADGFAASYFAHSALGGGVTGSPMPETRAVWNFDYDFLWLPELVESIRPSRVLCFDLPIIRETAVLETVAALVPVVIYDHHVVAADSPVSLPQVTFANSRILGGKQCNYPAAAFAAAFAAERGRVRGSDLAVLAVGLIGDRADRRNPTLFCHLREEYPRLSPAQLLRFTRELDALFRARVHCTPGGAELELSALLRDEEPSLALRRFAARYDLEAALHKVQAEIDGALRALGAVGHRSLICETLELETFCVGPIASQLAAQKAAEVVALGFPVDDRVAFELRTQNGGPDLTQVLELQGRAFTPLSAGGHPNAAGAMVQDGDATEFKRTLAEALTVYGREY